MNLQQPVKKPVNPWVWVGIMAVIAVIVGLSAGALSRRGDAPAPVAAPTTAGTLPNGSTYEYVEPLSEAGRKQLANKACRAELQLPTGAQFMDQGQVALVMTDGSDKVIVAGKVLLASGDRRSWRCEVIVLDDRTTQVREVGLR